VVNLLSFFCCQTQMKEAWSGPGPAKLAFVGHAFSLTKATINAFSGDRDSSAAKIKSERARCF
jgi:hypothetical protein